MNPLLAKYQDAIQSSDLLRRMGQVRKYLGNIVDSTGPDSSLGELCEIYPPDRTTPVISETVGFREDSVLLMPYGDLRGIRPGSQIVATGRFAQIHVSHALLGRVVETSCSVWPASNRAALRRVPISAAC
jgi:flagellum-specific ATP synthase